MARSPAVSSVMASGPGLGYTVRTSIHGKGAGDCQPRRPEKGDAVAEPHEARRDGDYYELLFVANPLPMWVFEIATGRFLAVNAQACAQYGYSEEEFLAMTIADIRPPDEKAKLAKVRSTGPVGHRDFGYWRHLKKDGTIIDVEISSDDIVFRGVAARLVLASDVTERVRIEMALRLSQERFDYVTRATEDALRDRNIVDNTIWWNEGLERLFGGKVEPSTEWGRERIHPDDRAQVVSRMDAAINGDGQQWSCEYRFLRHDGSYAFVYERGLDRKSTRLNSSHPSI